jgi:glycosyltransferase involved in cell wall biosynthesis
LDYAFRMLSVMIETRNHQDALARTLASLVSGAVEGVVREVLVHDRGSTDQTAAVADHAGCVIVPTGDLIGAIRRARGDWLLFVEPGARLSDGWVEAVFAHVAHAATPARFLRGREPDGGFLARLMTRSRPLSEGLLVSKRQALAKLQPGDGAEALARRFSSRRIGAEIMPARRETA